MDGTGGHEPALNGREVTLVTLVAKGLSNHEIGLVMHLSVHTIKHSIERLIQKLGVRNRVELAAWAGSNRHYDPRIVISEKGPPGPSRSRCTGAIIDGAGLLTTTFHE